MVLSKPGILLRRCLGLMRIAPFIEWHAIKRLTPFSFVHFNAALIGSFLIPAAQAEQRIFTQPAAKAPSKAIANDARAS
jgi:hypothetical protein